MALGAKQVDAFGREQGDGAVGSPVEAPITLAVAGEAGVVMSASATAALGTPPSDTFTDSTRAMPQYLP